MAERPASSKAPWRAATAGLAAIDHALGNLLARRAQGDGSLRRILGLTGALLSHQRGRGHACLELSAWAGRPLPRVSPENSPKNPPPRLPGREPWRRALLDSGLTAEVASDSVDLAATAEVQPLVLWGDRLYFWRYFQAERRLATRLRQGFQGAPHTPVGPDTLLPTTQATFRRLFQPPDESAIDWQAVAAAIALDRRLTLVSGGPGTGKTTTVCRLLALVLSTQPNTRVALAAPTGKAAARLAESIGAQLPTLDADPEVVAQIPRSATTLHRLLGFRPGEETFRHHAADPLDIDLLVVDEASMVDLLLMDALLDALPTDGRLVLLGDRDQLTSVEAGFVFADLCRASRTRPHSEALRAAWNRLAGRPWPGTDPPPDTTVASGLADAAVELTVSFRFRSRSGIGALANACRRGDGDGVVAALQDPTLEEVRLHPLPAGDGHEVLAPVAKAVVRVVEAERVEDALEHLARVRILTPHRQGPWGVEALNRRVEALLVDLGRLDPATRPRVDTPSRTGWRPGGWYRGCPVMITRNDRQLGLFNGDLGLCWPAEDEDPASADPGALDAVFATADGGVRRIALGKLPTHEPAWAMTVHKSQGSEFDQVLLILGSQDSQLLGRELLYTAVTRARESVSVVGDPQLLRAAVARRAQRRSGLPELLALPGTPTDSAITMDTAQPAPTEPTVPEPAVTEPETDLAAPEAAVPQAMAPEAGPETTTLAAATPEATSPATTDRETPKAESPTEPETAEPQPPGQLSLFDF